MQGEGVGQALRHLMVGYSWTERPYCPADMFCKDLVAHRCTVYLKFLDVTPAEAMPITVELAGV